MSLYFKILIGLSISVALSSCDTVPVTSKPERQNHDFDYVGQIDTPPTMANNAGVRKIKGLERPKKSSDVHSLKKRQLLYPDPQALMLQQQQELASASMLLQQQSLLKRYGYNRRRYGNNYYDDDSSYEDSDEYYFPNYYRNNGVYSPTIPGIHPYGIGRRSLPDEPVTMGVEDFVNQGQNEVGKPV